MLYQGETMDKFIINGGNTLNGVIEVPSAKNSYLAILAGCVLSSGVVCLHNCPKFDDIDKMLDILTSLGCKIERKEDRTLVIDCRNITNYVIPQKLAKKIRSSIFLLGPMLGRLKKVMVTYPGGCDIGSRPIDLHLKGLKTLNAKITERFGFIEAEAPHLVGETVHLDYPSVGATENIMMAGVLAKGTTKIFNSAKEPEIVDLQNFINAMGGKISGAGTDTITIQGVGKLGSVEYTPITDRIIAGTYLLAGASCGGDITIKNVDYEHIYSLITKLKNSGCKIDIKGDTIRQITNGRLKTFSSIETLPYPGFPTDLQPQALVLQTISEGTCIITENLFETRFKHTPELVKMGANIVTRDRMAIVTGTKKLYGADVTCYDLRAGSALTIAGMIAEGTTILNDVKNIDRGYEKLEDAFNKLGANIKRVTR